MADESGIHCGCHTFFQKKVFLGSEEFVFSEEVFLVAEARFAFTVGHVGSGGSGSSV